MNTLAMELRKISNLQSSMKARTNFVNSVYERVKEKCFEAARQGFFSVTVEAFKTLNQSSFVRTSNDLKLEELDTNELELYGRLKNDGFNITISRTVSDKDEWDNTCNTATSFSISWKV
jgi:hypothetical protein